MIKSERRIAIVGALVASTAVFGLGACAPANNASNSTNPANGATRINTYGQISVGVQLPTSQRQVTAVLDSLSSIDLAVAGAHLASPMTTTFAKAMLVNGSGFKNFMDVPAGLATVTATAKDVGGGTLATASADVTVVAGQTANATLNLTFNFGVISATITVTLIPTTSSAFPGIAPAGQAGAKYVGVATCATCHSGLANVYKQTAHWSFQLPDSNGAFASIMGKSPSSPGTAWIAGSCYSCHVVGEDVANPKHSLMVGGLPAGFDFSQSSSASANAAYLGIQCESCHGPGSNHVTHANDDGGVGASASYTITKTPSYRTTCVTCHSSGVGNTKKLGGPWTTAGATDADVNDGGSGATLHHPQGPVFLQQGGYNYGVVTASSSHNTQIANGCIDCHLVGGEPGLHEINIGKALSNKLVGSCQKCHGSNFDSASIDGFQAQTKLALMSLQNALVAYRGKFCTEVIKGSTKSTAAADIANLANAASKWSDSPAYVQTSTGSDKVNYTANSTYWSDHQKTFNRAAWNWHIVSDEKSFGIHAPTYEQTLLRNSYNALMADLNNSSTASPSYTVLSLKH